MQVQISELKTLKKVKITIEITCKLVQVILLLIIFVKIPLEVFCVQILLKIASFLLQKKGKQIQDLVNLLIHS